MAGLHGGPGVRSAGVSALGGGDRAKAAAGHVGGGEQRWSSGSAVGAGVGEPGIVGGVVVLRVRDPGWLGWCESDRAAARPRIGAGERAASSGIGVVESAATGAAQRAGQDGGAVAAAVGSGAGRGVGGGGSIVARSGPAAADVGRGPAPGRGAGPAPRRHRLRQAESHYPPSRRSSARSAGQVAHRAGGRLHEGPALSVLSAYVMNERPAEATTPLVFLASR